MMFTAPPFLCARIGQWREFLSRVQFSFKKVQIKMHFMSKKVQKKKSLLLFFENVL